MAQQQGTLLGAPVRRNDSQDAFPAAYNSEIAGGYHAVATYADLLSFPLFLRDWNMTIEVYADEDKTKNGRYLLRQGKADNSLANNANFDKQPPGVEAATQAEHEQAADDSAATGEKAATPGGLYHFWQRIKTLSGIYFADVVGFLGIHLGKGDTAGGVRSIAARGSEPHIDILLQPKGNGRIMTDYLAGADDRIMVASPAGKFLPGDPVASFTKIASLGATLFVSPGGNNATAAIGRIDRPYATLQGAFDALPAYVNTTIIVLPGNYAGNASIELYATNIHFPHIQFINVRYTGNITLTNHWDTLSKTIGVLDGTNTSSIIGTLTLTANTGNVKAVVKNFNQITDLQATTLQAEVDNIAGGISSSLEGAGYFVLKNTVFTASKAPNNRFAFRVNALFDNCQVTFPDGVIIGEAQFNTLKFINNCRVINQNAITLIGNYYPPKVSFHHAEITTSCPLFNDNFGSAAQLELLNCEVIGSGSGWTHLIQTSDTYRLYKLRSLFNVSNRPFSIYEPSINETGYNFISA